MSVANSEVTAAGFLQPSPTHSIEAASAIDATSAGFRQNTCQSNSVTECDVRGSADTEPGTESPDADNIDRLIGSTMGRFKIASVIASGGMGLESSLRKLRHRMLPQSLMLVAAHVIGLCCGDQNATQQTHQDGNQRDILFQHSQCLLAGANCKLMDWSLEALSRRYAISLRGFGFGFDNPTRVSAFHIRSPRRRRISNDYHSKENLGPILRKPALKKGSNAFASDRSADNPCNRKYPVA